MEDTHTTAQPRGYQPHSGIGKFSSARDEVIYRAATSMADDEIGDVHAYGFYAWRLVDYYGTDYVVVEDSQGFVTVEQLDDIAISGEIGKGYYSPSDDRWAELEDIVHSLDADVWEETERAARDLISRSVGRATDEAWPAYAWPGGYPIAYIVDDGESLCSDCVQCEAGVHFTGDSDGWRVDGVVVYGATTDYPEQDERCAHCDSLIAEGMGPI